MFMSARLTHNSLGWNHHLWINCLVLSCCSIKSYTNQDFHAPLKPHTNYCTFVQLFFYDRQLLGHTTFMYASITWVWLVVFHLPWRIEVLYIMADSSRITKRLFGFFYHFQARKWPSQSVRSLLVLLFDVKYDEMFFLDHIQMVLYDILFERSVIYLSI